MKLRCLSVCLHFRDKEPKFLLLFEYVGLTDTFENKCKLCGGPFNNKAF